MANENTAWQLEDFVDSLVVELDKTRETLAVKAINKPLSYTVKEVALDLNIFPSYDGDNVRFVTAQPGQQGASKVTIQLGSITDQQVRATSKVPTTKGDINLDQTGIDKPTKKKLRKLGVNSANDLKQIEQKDVDLKSVSDNSIDYSALANQIRKTRRDQNPPRAEDGQPQLSIRGENLAVDPKFRPVALVNQALAEVTSCSDKEIMLSVTSEHAFAHENELILTCDPFAVVKVNVRAGQKP
jgi:hypothetical protein